VQCRTGEHSFFGWFAAQRAVTRRLGRDRCALLAVDTKGRKGKVDQAKRHRADPRIRPVVRNQNADSSILTPVVEDDCAGRRWNRVLHDVEHLPPADQQRLLRWLEAG
jgi:hypothetical protein